MGIRKKAKDKQRAMQVPSYTYARMTRRWRSAPNRANILVFNVGIEVEEQIK